MKIYNISTPVFEYNGEKHHVISTMIGTKFSDIDNFIEYRENKAEKEGIKVILIIYSISNTSDNKLISPIGEPNKGIIFLRYKFIKEVEDQEPKEVNNL